MVWYGMTSQNSCDPTSIALELGKRCGPHAMQSGLRGFEIKSSRWADLDADHELS